MRKKIVASVLLNIFLTGSVLASANYSYQGSQNYSSYSNQYQQQPLQYPVNNTLQGNVVMVPAGSTIKAMLTAPLSSEYSTDYPVLNPRLPYCHRYLLVRLYMDLFSRLVYMGR